MLMEPLHAVGVICFFSQELEKGNELAFATGKAARKKEQAKILGKVRQGGLCAENTMAVRSRPRLTCVHGCHCCCLLRLRRGSSTRERSASPPQLSLPPLNNRLQIPTDATQLCLLESNHSAAIQPRANSSRP